MFLLLGILVTQCHIAESGNSILKCPHQLWLLEAAHDVISTMLTQIHEFKPFLTQLTSSCGQGPCSLTHEGQTELPRHE